MNLYLSKRRISVKFRETYMKPHASRKWICFVNMRIKDQNITFAKYYALHPEAQSSRELY